MKTVTYDKIDPLQNVAGRVFLNSYICVGTITVRETEPSLYKSACALGQDLLLSQLQEDTYFCVLSFIEFCINGLSLSFVFLFSCLIQTGTETISL